MTPRALIRQSAKQLMEASIPDPTVDAALLLSHITGKPALHLRLDDDTELSSDILHQYKNLLEKRLQRIPLQHLTGVQSFYGRDFTVDGRVLIPRPETELLCERAIACLRPLTAPTALDLCCGSGCLAITMQLETNATVHAADLSIDALQLAKQNAADLGAPVTFHQGDLFDAVSDMQFDIIVSNPPYIPSADCRTLQMEVRFEPSMALNGGEDGYDFYRRIANEAPAHLTENGVVLLEVGFDQAETVAQLMQDAGFASTQIFCDYNDIPRMVVSHLHNKEEAANA